MGDWMDARFFPAPSTVAVALWNLVTNGELLGPFWLLPGKIRDGRLGWSPEGL